MTSVQGTSEYMAPEQFVTELGVGPKADIWAFGATLVHMLSGSPPFAGSSMAQICMKVATQRQQPELPWQAHSSPALAQLLQGCFAYEPRERLSAVDALRLLGEAMAAAGMGPGGLQAATSLEAGADEEAAEEGRGSPRGGSHSAALDGSTGSSAAAENDQGLQVQRPKQQRLRVGRQQPEPMFFHAPDVAQRSAVTPTTPANNLSLSAAGSFMATSIGAYNGTDRQGSHTARADSCSTNVVPGALASQSSGAPASVPWMPPISDTAWMPPSSTPEGVQEGQDSIPALVRLLGSSNATAQEQAARLLGTLGKDCTSNQAAITQAGAIPRLVQLLSSSHVKVQVHAARALAHLAWSNNSNQQDISNAGAIPQLTDLLRSSSSDVQQQAARALHHLALGNSSNQQAIAHLAGQALEELLNDSTEDVRKLAAKVLAAVKNFRMWSSGVLDCCDDPGIFCIGLW